MIQLDNRWADLDEIWYVHYAVGGILQNYNYPFLTFENTIMAVEQTYEVHCCVIGYSYTVIQIKYLVIGQSCGNELVTSI